MDQDFDDEDLHLLSESSLPLMSTSYTNNTFVRNNNRRRSIKSQKNISSDNPILHEEDTSLLTRANIGDIIRLKDGTRKKYNGSTWRRMCSQVNCSYYSQSEGLCKLHLNELKTQNSSRNNNSTIHNDDNILPIDEVLSKQNEPKKGDIIILLNGIRKIYDGRHYRRICAKLTCTKTVHGNPEYQNGLCSDHYQELHVKNLSELKSSSQDTLSTPSNSKVSSSSRKRRRLNSPSSSIPSQVPMTSNIQISISKPNHRLSIAAIPPSVDINNPKKGDIIVMENGSRKKFDGVVWRKICSMSGCLIAAQRDELCRKHFLKLNGKPNNGSTNDFIESVTMVTPLSKSISSMSTSSTDEKSADRRYKLLFVLSDILRPIWTQKLIELKSLSKQDKTIYYIFHKIHDYNEIKILLKQLEYFLKKLAPHMCCIWSNKDDLPEYNEQLAQRIYAQQNIQTQSQQQQHLQQQQISTINTNNNLYLRSALTGRLNEQTPHQQQQQQTIHHAHSYPNISSYAQSPFGHSNALNTSLGGGINPAADFTLSSPSPSVPTSGSLFSSSMHNIPPTPLITNSTNPNQQFFLSATSLSSITDLLQEIDYYRTICHMIERLIELLSLWQIINEHRTDMLIERLPESYLTLFNGTSGPFTVRTLLELDTLFYDTLIAALLTSYEQNESIFDQLMGRLVDECPKLCPIEKLILYKVDLFLKPSTTSITNQSINDQHQRLKQACQLYKQVCDRVNITSFAMTLYTFRMYDELLDLCVTAGTKRDPCNQALNYYYGQLDDQQQYIDVYQRCSECYQSLIDILELLYQRDGDNILKTNDGSLTLNEFIRHCLSYDDEFLHVKLFDWMMNKQFNEKIKSYRQITPYLERFIRYRLKLTNFNDYITLDVAIAVLQVVKDYTTLCQVLLHLIDLSDPRVTFADRLCYLAEALQIARSANATLLSTSQQIKPSNDSQLSELIPTLEQRLQTAFVQKQIYTDLQMYMRALETHTITSTSINEDLQQYIQHVQDSIKKLNLALFDATELFVDYAQKYELYECQLLLLQLDGNEEPTILQTIWRRLLRKEVNDLFPSATNLTGGNYERIMILQQHLIERLRNCRKKRLRLPMDFIRSELKQIVHTINNLSDHGDTISSEDFSNQILSDL
ncbi:unnamed protein product [Rotaria sp. Silwood2]|nr:unnamed protein product [Rotaria sp. Silwood2]